MRKFVSWLLLILAFFTPVAVVSGLISLYLQMSAINNGTTTPQISTGHIYAINAQRFADPKLIAYVTYNYHISYLISSSIFFIWLVSIIVIAAVVLVFGLNKQVK
jgi:hypothetical protein